MATPLFIHTVVYGLQVQEADSDAETKPSLPTRQAAYRPPVSSNLHLTAAAAPFVPLTFDDLSHEVMADCLETVFGYKGFRGQQLRVVKNVMAGQSTLAILPTGEQFVID